MASLVANGVPASLAAGVLTSAPAIGAAPVSEAAPVSGAAQADLDLVGAATSLDPQRLWATIDQAFTRCTFEQVVEDWLLPELVRLGDAWESGHVSVAQEHFASAGLMRAISAVYDAAPPSAPSGPAVLVGLPGGAHHELALFCFATCLRRQGSTVVYLGADIPEDAWRDAAERRRARAAVIGVTAAREVVAAQDVADQLATVVPPLSIWVGGSCRTGVRGPRLLPDSVVEAARLVSQSLRAGSA
jgi:methanogenic corrinoid protein MtbC1